ncbi:MAG: hypothetical protein Q7K29_00760 [Thermoleophilia bacterium]|nr:hypothetical protein [Thermoleophilia bacterium]
MLAFEFAGATGHGDGDEERLGAVFETAGLVALDRGRVEMDAIAEIGPTRFPPITERVRYGQVSIFLLFFGQRLIRF